MIRYRMNWDKGINLQLFAGEKTEKATPKKRQDARRKGQVFQSRDITSAIVLICVFIGMRVFGGYIYSEIAAFTKKLMTVYIGSSETFTFGVLSKLFIDTIIVFLKTTAPILAIAFVTGLIAEYAQVGFLFTVETLGFKFDRINPISGFKRIFSLHGVVELLKAILKVTVICYIVYSYLKGETRNVISMMNMDVMGLSAYIGMICINVAIRICIALIFLGVLDFGYQWWQYEKNLKMSKDEIKEEYKQIEGNPEIKSKIKQKQRQMSMRRMMTEVPKADVVITNPTHFAVAVKYDTKISDAPYVLAKGQDFIALRIKDMARENSVQVVENKPLARTLYETVDIGESIPADLYQAVAEVLAFVYSLKGKDQVG